MFDLGWPELLVIAIVLIVVVGPKDLPGLLRSFGRTTTKLRTMAGDFRKQFDEALREAELDEVKGLVDDARKLDPRSEVRKHLDPLEKAGRDIRTGLDEAMKPKSATQAPQDSLQEAGTAASEAKRVPRKTQAAPDAGPITKTKRGAKKTVTAKKTATAKKAPGTKPAAAKQAQAKPPARPKKTMGRAS